MTSPSDNTLVARAKTTFRVHDEMTYYEGHPDIVANELITALEASYAENERLTEALRPFANMLPDSYSTKDRLQAKLQEWCRVARTALKDSPK